MFVGHGDALKGTEKAVAVREGWEIKSLRFCIELRKP